MFVHYIESLKPSGENKLIVYESFKLFQQHSKTE